MRFKLREKWDLLLYFLVGGCKFFGVVFYHFVVIRTVKSAAFVINFLPKNCGKNGIYCYIFW
jgi:hypothetical protein